MGNNGIINNGGTFNVGQMAVGKGASVSGRGSVTQHQLLATLDRLQDELRAANLPSGQRRELTRAVDTLKDEARSQSPDRSLIERSLTFLGHAAASATGMAGAVKAVKAAVDLFF